MALTFHSSTDKSTLVDMVFTIVQKLVFHGIKRDDQIKIAQHFTDLRATKEDFSVACHLTVNRLNETKIAITITPVKHVRQN